MFSKLYFEQIVKFPREAGSDKVVIFFSRPPLLLVSLERVCFYPVKYVLNDQKEGRYSTGASEQTVKRKKRNRGGKNRERPDCLTRQNWGVRHRWKGGRSRSAGHRLNHRRVLKVGKGMTLAALTIANLESPKYKGMPKR